MSSVSYKNNVIYKSNENTPTHTHTHTHIYIYIYMCVCVCVCVCVCLGRSHLFKQDSSNNKDKFCLYNFF